MQLCNALANDSGRSIAGPNLRAEVAPIMMVCLFICLGAREPKALLKWLAANRLTPYSMPGYKSTHVADLKKMLGKRDLMDLSAQQQAMLRLLIDKLETKLGKDAF